MHPHLYKVSGADTWVPWQTHTHTRTHTHTFRHPNVFLSVGNPLLPWEEFPPTTALRPRPPIRHNCTQQSSVDDLRSMHPDVYCSGKVLH